MRGIRTTFAHSLVVPSVAELFYVRKGPYVAMR